MVLVAKKNDKTNRTSNENMVEALLLVAPNINIKKGKTPEFTYLSLDTLEPITRGSGIKMRIDQKYVTKLIQVAMTPTSQFFCPSFAKLSKTTEREANEGKLRSKSGSGKERVRSTARRPQSGFDSYGG